MELMELQNLQRAGFNFIPALNCYLPNSIDEIGFVSENHTSLIFENYYNTKLNIITEKRQQFLSTELQFN